MKTDPDQKILLYGISCGLLNFTLDELIASHRRQRETIKNWGKYAKAVQALRTALDEVDRDR